MGWIAELDRRGVGVRQDDAVLAGARQTGRDCRACLLAHPTGEAHYEFFLAIRPGMDTGEFENVCREVVQRVDRLKEHGPDPDGWQVRTDGDLQLWLAAHLLDPWLADGE